MEGQLNGVHAHQISANAFNLHNRLKTTTVRGIANVEKSIAYATVVILDTGKSRQSVHPDNVI